MKRPRTPTTLLLLIPLAACAPEEEEGQPVEMAAATADVVMMMPVSTESSEALNDYMQGRRALDMGRVDDARPHFQQAVAADADFALAYLDLANAANSLESFTSNLDLARQHAEGASEAERLLIEFVAEGFDNDVEAQLQIGRQLTELEPESPRAWMTLGNAQSAAGDAVAARTSWAQALEVSPEFTPAHMALGNSYTFVEPRDLDMALQHMQAAVRLEPDEPVPHDLLGDVYRARGDLEQAAQEYTRVTELDPESGSGFQQRAHVHSFLGDLDQARSDYDAAIELEDGNAKASFGVYRALVNVHAGDPQAAVAELERLVDEIDGMGIPAPRNQKIFALNTLIQIALHHDMIDAAEQAMARRDALLMEQAQQAGTEAALRQARATIAWGEGYLSARKGDYETAVAKANEFMTIMEPSTDPEKNEPAHALLGYVNLWQENYAEAAAHFEQASPDNIYVNYHHALALEGAGREEEAQALFQKVANWNFNSAALALVRADAIARAS